MELIRRHTQIVDLFREHTHLEHKTEKEDHHEGEIAKQAKLVVAVALKWLSNRREEEDNEREDKANDELLLGARIDVHADADKEYLRAKAKVSWSEVVWIASTLAWLEL